MVSVSNKISVKIFLFACHLENIITLMIKYIVNPKDGRRKTTDRNHHTN